MSLPDLFWMVSWSLCGLALTVPVALVGWRGWANRRSEAVRRKREHYMALLKARAERPHELADDVLTDLTVEILDLVRGDEKARFAERVARAGAAEQLRARLRKGNVRTRILAAAALQNFRDGATGAALAQALDDRNPEVRLTAALSLAAAGHAPPPKEVIRRLGIGERETSLLTIILLAEMARTDLENVRSLLVDAATAPWVRAATAEALALCDDFASVPIIGSLAMEADPWAAELPRYLAALAEMEHPAGSPAVLHCLHSPSAQVRAAAARAAGRIETDSALDRLDLLLGDPDWWVRFQSGQALLRLGEEGLGRLRRTAAGGEEPARETATLTLAEQAQAE